jgi:hypothetical protein
MKIFEKVFNTFWFVFSRRKRRRTFVFYTHHFSRYYKSHLSGVFRTKQVLVGVARLFIVKPKNANLGKFWRALDWRMLTHFKALWCILQTFGIFYDHSVHFVVIWYIFYGFGIVYLEKSGNPGLGATTVRPCLGPHCGR